ncbi:ankyrin repeat-containing protein BDA1-like [Andrographis paniculata]|uniref:ankyrin repeat-containing protein BDA1-like n=1 Tax=Andrographis paniculata TaxID=175694 RepID=UPI0021E6EFA5|nr:ankyrin repeat-containing protein BDA1-like [Andrographis paniculata]
MDEELYKASLEGNTNLLLTLVQQDRLILDRANSITSYLETPLHVAAMRGHKTFVTELLKIKPELTSELDWRQSSPLHLASLKGHAEIAKILAQKNPGMCLARDRDGRNPIHVAAVMGRIETLKELITAKPEAARAMVDGGDTVLHLCVKYSQLDALKLLMDTTDCRDLVNSKNRDGNTTLHLAVVEKQVEITEFLLSLDTIEVNATSSSGTTAMDILIKRKIDSRDIKMEEILKNAGALGTRPETIIDPPRLVDTQKNPYGAISEYPKNPILLSPKEFQKLIKKSDDWLDKKRSAMMVVATLIASMAFQVGINPPANVWENNTKTTTSARPGDVQYYLTKIYVYLKKYAPFYIVNTAGFIASLSIIFLLMSGLPLKNRVSMWALMVITWIAITAIAVTYTVSLILNTPDNKKSSIYSIIGITVFVWICLMALLVFGHTLRLLFKTVKMFVKVLRPIRKKPRRLVQPQV